MQRHVHIADIIEVMADHVGDRTALVTSDAIRSYGELDMRATRLANHLAEHGVGPGDHVGIHAMNCVEWAEAFYACFKIRAIPVNVNYRYVEAELCHLYDDSDCVAVIVAPEFVDALDQVADALPGLKHRLVLGEEYEAALAAASPERSFGERSPDDVYLVYTGGTTGLPKGVMWRQEDIVLGALNAYRQGAPIADVEQLGRDAAANPTPLTLMMMGPLMHGGSQWAMGNVHVAGGTALVYSKPTFDAQAVLHMAADGGANSLSVIGDAMARPIADAILDPDIVTPDLPALMAISNGGAPISVGVRERLGKALPDKMIVDSYGSSETGTTGINPDPSDHAVPRFMTGPETTVLDSDLQHCAPGVVGMLAKSGNIPLGYHKDPEKTAATFPVVDGQRWVIAGDLARIEDDGSISVLGRDSVSINSGGEKISPEEVESALGQHPAVGDVAVVGTPSERWGEQVTALVQAAAGTEPEALREHCRGLIADYKIPKQVLMVDLVPRTPVGKVDYKAARTVAADLLGSGS